jgi:hypothetical protein
MANELSQTLKKVAEKIAEYVGDAATLTVTTQYVELDVATANFEAAKPVASTTITLDADSRTVIPMRRTEAGVLETDDALYELHQRNVATAIDYRARMMNAMLQTLREAVIR